MLRGPSGPLSLSGHNRATLLPHCRIARRRGPAVIGIRSVAVGKGLVMVRFVLAVSLAIGFGVTAAAWSPRPPQPALSPAVRPVWAPACTGLAPGVVVRSARPQKDGGGTDRRRFWRGHWQVTQVLDGGRFLAQPLYRKDDSTGEIDRAAFGPFPGETARTPPGALDCAAFVSE